MCNMQIGVKPPKKDTESSPNRKKRVGAIDSGQKNNLMNYFGKTATASNFT